MGDPSTLQCDFDRVMSPAHQARWIVEVGWRDRDGLRADDPDLRGRYAPRFDRLRAMAAWREVEEVLRRYVRAAIPAPRRSERSFWGCACLPESDEALVLAQVEVGPEDVCTVTAEGELTFSFRLGLNPLDLPRVATRTGLSVADLRRRPDGDVEVVLSAVGGASALGLFDDDVVVRGMRRFNLDLARRGHCTAADRHNFSLADALLAEADAPAARAPDPAPPGAVPPDAPFEVALAFVDRLIGSGECEAACAALEAVGLRRGPSFEAAEVVARLERAAPRVADAGRAASAMLAIVTHRAGLGDDAGVLAWFLRALDLRGREAALPVARMMAAAGRAHRRTGHPARGVELLTRALERIPRDGPHAPAEHLVELGRCYTALGDVGAALDHLDEALRSAESVPAGALPLAARVARAEAHLRAGDAAAARASLGSALALARVQGCRAVLAGILAPFAWCEERLGAVPSAVAHYAEALALVDDAAKPGLRRGVLAGLVRCHDRRGETAEADAYLQRAEAMEGSAWPVEGQWPLDDLIEAVLALDEPTLH